MPIYRAFEADDTGPFEQTPTMIEAKSGVQAIMKAMQTVNGNAMELLDETRRICVI